jgi:hypothetical protein
MVGRLGKKVLMDGGVRVFVKESVDRAHRLLGTHMSQRASERVVRSTDGMGTGWFGWPARFIVQKA